MNPTPLSREVAVEPDHVLGLTKASTSPRFLAEYEVYRLLRDSRSPRDAAAVVGISRTMIYRYAARLVKAGAVQIVPGARPAVYEAGPKARQYEAMHATDKDRAGGKGPVGIRSHDWRFTWPYDYGPVEEPKWEKTWEPSGVFNGRMFFTLNSRKWRVEDRRGVEERSLNLMLVDDEWEFEPQKVSQIARRLRREAARVGRAFQRVYKYGLVGEVRFAGEPHYALTVAPSVMVEGVSGVTDDWIDGSPRAGASQREYESTDTARMARALQIDQRFDEIERRLERAEAIARAAMAQVRRASPGQSMR